MPTVLPRPSPVSDLPTNAACTTRFNIMLAYIDANLQGDPSIKTLSQAANFSAFHFHRQFTAYVGLSVARYVQLERMMMNIRFSTWGVQQP